MFFNNIKSNLYNRRLKIKRGNNNTNCIIETHSRASNAPLKPISSSLIKYIFRNIDKRTLAKLTTKKNIGFYSNLITVINLEEIISLNNMPITNKAICCEE